jgi:hypothetical protein
MRPLIYAFVAALVISLWTGMAARHGRPRLADTRGYARTVLMANGAPLASR